MTPDRMTPLAFHFTAVWFWPGSHVYSKCQFEWAKGAQIMLCVAEDGFELLIPLFPPPDCLL